MGSKSKLKEMAKMAAQNQFLPAIYRKAAGSPVRRNEIIFADAHHDTRPESLELLYRMADSDPHFEVREMYLNFGSAGVGARLAYMKNFMREYAQAGTVVICDNFLPAASCRKRPETKVVQLWHACGALKKFGYDTEDDIPPYYRGNVFQNTDLMTVSSEFCRRPFASATRLPLGNVQALGVSRTDRYFDPAWKEECLKKFRKAYPEAADKKVVVWAPTFRGSAGNPEIEAPDLAKLQRTLGDDYFVIASLHPHMAGKFHIQNSRLATDELFPAADVLIADYSSIIFEYLLFDRPLILYTPDFEKYTQNRGFYMDYADIPGTQVMEESALAEAVAQAVREGAGGMPMRGKREHFLKKYMSGCDGHATERIFRRIREWAGQ